MIRTVCFRRNRSVLLSRASLRRGDLLPPTQPTAPALLQMTLPIVLKAPLATAILRSHQPVRPS